MGYVQIAFIYFMHSCKVRGNLLETVCSSLYGSQWWNLDSLPLWQVTPWTEPFHRPMCHLQNACFNEEWSTIHFTDKTIPIVIHGLLLLNLYMYMHAFMPFAYIHIYVYDSNDKYVPFVLCVCPFSHFFLGSCRLANICLMAFMHPHIQTNINECKALFWKQRLLLCSIFFPK